MSHRKKVNEQRTVSADVQYQNKFAQLVALVGARKTYCELGRGSAKTTDIQVERLIDLIYDMPGAPVVWVADTFSNLSANVLPSVLEGLERKGFREGVHYVIEQEPPQFSEKEKENLPEWLRPHFWKPFNRLVTYKRTILFFSGLNIRFGSLDRPSSLAGASYVFVFGDEAKYFREEKIANLLKAVRGYNQQYGSSVFYRGVLFTSDVADPSHVGEYAWLQKQAGNMNMETVLAVIRCGLVANEALHEYVAAKDRWLKTKSMDDLTECRAKLRTANLWRSRWIALRRTPRASTFYIRASSYVNADILTPEWFSDAIEGALPDLKTAILSMRPSLRSGDRFYAALSAGHFYWDGIDEAAYDRVSLMGAEDCRVLKYLDRGKPLRLGVDFGNMCSMTIGQLQQGTGRDTLRIVKFLYTLAPEHIPELAEKFRTYFAPMQNRVVFLYYDRAGNAYRKIKKDNASELKRAIERDSAGRPTGWNVHLMSIGQGNIGQAEEYDFMLRFMSGQEPRLPELRIDAFAAKPLKLSLENARTRIKDGMTHKDKSTEKLEISRLPWESTNPSDSFKYLVMTKEWRDILRRRASAVPGNLDIVR